MLINTVLIDDDKFAMKELEFMLGPKTQLRIIGKFLDPLEGLSHFDELKPQVVFLDINMPSINGLELAIKLKEKSPELIIVFTSAFDEYAIEAFNLYAIDYLLKPISTVRFESTLKRIMELIETRELLDQNKQKEINCKLYIKTFGKFEIGFEGQEPIRWRTEKIKELFVFLLHNANKELPKDVLLNVIFNRGSLGNSTHQLHNAIYYIKNALFNYGISKDLIDITGKYLLKVNENLIDSFQFKQWVGKIKNREVGAEEIRRIENLYTGDYLEDIDMTWVSLEREYLRRRYMEVVNYLSGFYLQQERFSDAEEILIKAYNRDPYFEDITIKLLTVYIKSKRNDLAIKHYKDYERILIKELGISPEKEIRDIIKMQKLTG